MLTTTLSDFDADVVEHIRAHTAVRFENVGIGAYEFWGAKGFDRRMAHVTDGGEVAARLPVSDLLEEMGEGPWFMPMDPVELDGVTVDVSAAVVAVDRDFVTMEITWTQR